MVSTARKRVTIALLALRFLFTASPAVAIVNSDSETGDLTLSLGASDDQVNYRHSDTRRCT